jgi:cell division septation protein DedD
MWINALAGFFLLWQPVAEVPNYFPNFLQAREAAEKRQKPMVIFISATDCERCDAAWNAFTKDNQAVNGNVSTRVELENFDGKVIAELYESEITPSWVVLDANGKVMSSWSGGWKDAAGNPTMFIEPEVTAKPKVISTPVQVPVNATSTTEVVKTNPKPTPPSAPPAGETVKSTPQPSPMTTKENPTPASTAGTSATQGGYVLQAGYFGSEANAQKCIADMKSKGCGEYTIKTNVKDGTTYYRVISKSYPAESDANAAMNAANASGAKVAVKKVTEL